MVADGEIDILPVDVHAGIDEQLALLFAGLLGAAAQSAPQRFAQAATLVVANESGQPRKSGTKHIPPGIELAADDDAEHRPGVCERRIAKPLIVDSGVQLILQRAVTQLHQASERRLPSPG